ncbi:MAG TPA: hypothetical protein ENL09_03105, partial [Bacteroidetes bacterium]|nr:hypothetical protein [Bacteroidota bacterium]
MKKAIFFAFLFFIFFNLEVNPAQAYLLNGVDLLGQIDLNGNPTFDTRDVNNPYTNQLSGAVLNKLGGIEFDFVHHRLFVADRYNNRVLIFNLSEDNQLEDIVADYVLCQNDFSSNTSGLSQSQCEKPRYVAYDSNHDYLFVSDQANYRVLVFDLSNGITNGMNATYVLGQDNFESEEYTDEDNSPPTANRFVNTPYDILYDKSRDYLYVSDINGNRVLVFDLSNGITNGMNASFVLGQDDFTSKTENLNQMGTVFPNGLALDSVNQRLFVVNGEGANRVMVFDVSEIANGEPAINVIGQPDFITGTTGTDENSL